MKWLNLAGILAGLTIVTSLVPGCLGEQVKEGCAKDTDCNAGRVCNQGTCADVPPTPTVGADGGPLDQGDAGLPRPVDASAPVPQGDAGPGVPVGTSCEPLSNTCGGTLGCCRVAGSGSQYATGIPPKYSCQVPGAGWECTGAPIGSLCDSMIDNDPYRCASGLLCCTPPAGGPYKCVVSGGGFTCSL
jgi:hypothetical protein